MEQTNSLAGTNTGASRITQWRLIRYWLLPIFWMGLIYYLSSLSDIPAPSLGSFDIIVRKLGHVVEYAVLFFFLFRALNSLMNTKGAFLIAAVVAVVYACFDEYHQTFVPFREGTARDVLVDSVGILIMYIFLRRYYTRLPRIFR
jgi:VanZ family protein